MKNNRSLPDNGGEKCMKSKEEIFKTHYAKLMEAHPGEYNELNENDDLPEIQVTYNMMQEYADQFAIGFQNWCYNNEMWRTSYSDEERLDLYTESLIKQP